MFSRLHFGPRSRIHTREKRLVRQYRRVDGKGKGRHGEYPRGRLYVSDEQYKT